MFCRHKQNCCGLWIEHCRMRQELTSGCLVHAAAARYAQKQKAWPGTPHRRHLPGRPRASCSCPFQGPDSGACWSLPESSWQHCCACTPRNLLRLARLLACAGQRQPCPQKPLPSCVTEHATDLSSRLPDSFFSKQCATPCKMHQVRLVTSVQLSLQLP